MTRASRTSVVLATYNGERFLGEQLASLAAQRLLPLELVVADDGSGDGTMGILERFAATVPFPVRLLPGGHLGSSGNFLRGLAAASGDYVAWCDQDDIWHPAKLAVCERILTATGAGMVVHAATRVDAAGVRLGPLGGSGLRWLPTRCGRRFLVPHGFRQVFRRALVDGRDPAERPPAYADTKPMLHDEWTSFLAQALGPVVWIPVPLARYRVHESNESGAPRERTPLYGSLVQRPEDPNRHRGVAAAERASYLTGLAPGSADGERLQRAAHSYERLARFYDDRMRVYEGERSRRVAAFAQLLASRAYRPPRSGGLGIRGLARDALAVARGE